jgi:hypothetical protein
MFAYECDQIAENGVHLFSPREGNVRHTRRDPIYILNNNGYTQERRGWSQHRLSSGLNSSQWLVSVRKPPSRPQEITTYS